MLAQPRVDSSQRAAVSFGSRVRAECSTLAEAEQHLRDRVKACVVIASSAVAPKKPLVVHVSSRTSRELQEVARRTRRSVAFIIHRALLASPRSSQFSGAGEATEGLVVELAEEDPRDLASKIRHAAGDPIEPRVEGAWADVRERFLAWASKEESTSRVTKNDDLDRGLADAADPSTSAERLAALAKSDYPKIRALVAAHPATPIDVLSVLARDRERVVRGAVRLNPRTPDDIRKNIRAG